MNPSRYRSFLPSDSSGSGDSCWGLESSPPTFSSSCNNAKFSRFASQHSTLIDCTPYTKLLCTARHCQQPHAITQLSLLHRHAQGCPLHTKAHLSHGGQEAPQPSCHPHGQHTAKPPSHNTSLPEEKLTAAISSY